mmetsp:Transcript_24165/g.75893  ORF Transcript_24165/g.75893 Transcript_24165/m.75893 type:complete len:351 (-) Transcript_24165:3-1055(-)
MVLGLLPPHFLGALAGHDLVHAHLGARRGARGALPNLGARALLGGVGAGRALEAARRGGDAISEALVAGGRCPGRDAVLNALLAAEAAEAGTLPPAPATLRPLLAPVVLVLLQISVALERCPAVPPVVHGPVRVPPRRALRFRRRHRRLRRRVAAPRRGIFPDIHPAHVQHLVAVEFLKEDLLRLQRVGLAAPLVDLDEHLEDVAVALVHQHLHLGREAVPLGAALLYPRVLLAEALVVQVQVRGGDGLGGQPRVQRLDVHRLVELHAGRLHRAGHVGRVAHDEDQERPDDPPHHHVEHEVEHGQLIDVRLDILLHPRDVRRDGHVPGGRGGSGRNVSKAQWSCDRLGAT